LLPAGIPECPELPREVRVGEDWQPVAAGPAYRSGKRRHGEVLEPWRFKYDDSRRVPDKLVDRQYGGVPKGYGHGKGVQRTKWSKAQLTAMLKKALAADDGYWARRVINGLIVRAAKGNPAAQRIVWERAEGLLTERMELSGEVRLQKAVLLADVRRPPELPEREVDVEVVE
jgi:hypothetical protein